VRARTASRTVSGISSSPAASASVTKNGLPAVFRCSSFASTPWGAANFATATCESGASSRTADPLSGGEFPEHDAQRMCAVELVVPVTDNDKRRNSLQPAPDEPEDVQGGLIRPMDIIEDDDRRRPPLELPRELEDDLMWLAPARNELRELAARDLRDIDKRSKRPRSEERVTRAPQDSRISALVPAKMP